MAIRRSAASRKSDATITGGEQGFVHIENEKALGACLPWFHGVRDWRRSLRKRSRPRRRERHVSHRETPWSGNRVDASLCLLVSSFARIQDGMFDLRQVKAGLFRERGAGPPDNYVRPRVRRGRTPSIQGGAICNRASLTTAVANRCSLGRSPRQVG